MFIYKCIYPNMSFSICRKEGLLVIITGHVLFVPCSLENSTYGGRYTGKGSDGFFKVDMYVCAHALVYSNIDK